MHKDKKGKCTKNTNSDDYLLVVGLQVIYIASSPFPQLYFWGFSYSHSENIKWEIPEKNNLEVLNCLPFYEA
jgi:hypothetical protein